MKSSHLTHGAWSLAALGTFGLGLLLAKPSGSRNDTDSKNLLTVRSGNVSGTAGDAAGLSAKSAGAGSDRTATTSRPALLTPDQIEALAKEALSDPNPLTRNLA